MSVLSTVFKHPIKHYIGVALIMTPFMVIFGGSVYAMGIIPAIAVFVVSAILMILIGVGTWLLT